MWEKEIKVFQQNILSWYEAYKRDLPWRNTTDPYKIFLSEVMSQQTQINRVIPKYEAFLQKAATIKDLAEMDNATLLWLWSGLGFNMRALRMKQTAQSICEKYQWIFPNSYEALLELPWIWPYTASAICAFAYNQDVAVVDINVKRLFIHQFKLDIQTKEKDIRIFAQQFIPVGNSRIRHNALMDYSAYFLNGKNTWVKSSPQSHFLSSKRRIRGLILKHVLQGGTARISEIEKLYFHEELDNIIEWMIKDGIIEVTNQQISIKK